MRMEGAGRWMCCQRSAVGDEEARRFSNAGTNAAEKSGAGNESGRMMSKLGSPELNIV